MVNFFGGTNIPIFAGIEVLEFYSLSGVDKWAQLGYESLFFVGFFVLAWAALAFIKHQKR
jgi:ATP-binding cassette, subfamily G (WHITE), member 2